MSNHLKHQTSPYLLQHAENPVDWYPWSEEAFSKARAEDKPVFLSIGYSTCHWCHVMAHESFEDHEIADILNKYYVSIKVDKEERPDIDGIYMAVCQAFTGSGGWPASIFMTADQKPFFAGTYFPKTARYGSVGLKELLLTIHRKWKSERDALLRSADKITEALNRRHAPASQADEALLDAALQWYTQNFDALFGGFGGAPKFPTPHNLLFLMQQYEKHGNYQALNMAEITLQKMYAGGIFDHIGYGFCRYSTDRYYLVPHFEKMLYDNALLMLAYCKAYELTGRSFYLEVAQKTASYVFTEMTAPNGGFYSAQDADSDGEEGKYYVFTPEEIIGLLGQADGAAFCERFGITKAGNFEGKSIPNLLHAKSLTDKRLDHVLPVLREYRRGRTHLHTDDKILTAWNALMIAALCRLYQCSQNPSYLEAAKRAQEFIENNLCSQNTLSVSVRNGKLSEHGFLDDYASYIFALLSLYDVTLERTFLRRAVELTEETVIRYYDSEHGGFYLSGPDNETLLFRPKECYDGALPSGNSLIAYVLVRLNALLPDANLENIRNKQLAYMAGEAERSPAGFSMFLMALSDFLEPPVLITVVPNGEDLSDLPFAVPSDAIVKILDRPLEGYKLLNDKTTFYVCRGHSCLPPMNKRQLMLEILKQEQN
mgnify:CR=1 FL=1